MVDLSLGDVLGKVVSRRASDDASPRPDITTNNSSVLKDARRLLLGAPESPGKQARRERAERLRAAHSGGETRTTVVVNGTQRPIRLDTHSEPDRLNSLVRDVKHSALNEKNHEISRKAKMISIAAEVDRLQMDRAVLPFEVPNWNSESWRSVNVQKPRGQPGNVLHYTNPENRKRHLNAIECAALQALQAAEVARLPRVKARHTPTAHSLASTAPVQAGLEASCPTTPRRTVVGTVARGPPKGYQVPQQAQVLSNKGN